MRATPRGRCTLVAFVWMIYGLIHEEKPIIYLYAMLLALDAFIVTETFLYG